MNRGNNAAENVLYSGTIGGAMEAALQGAAGDCPVAVPGPAHRRPGRPVRDRADPRRPRWFARLLDHGLWDERDYRLFYNVNFPPVPAADVQGVKVAAQGFRRDTAFGVEPHMSPSGRKFLWIKGGPQHTPTEPGTDAAVNLDGYISVTPMRADLTAHDSLGRAGRRRLA